MTDSVTINYGWSYPTVNADADTWGATLNTTIIAIDSVVYGVSVTASAAAVKSNNLSDLSSATSARTNLGLGTAATKTASDNTQTNVASVIGAVANQVVFYSDSNGTINAAGFDYTDVATLSGNLSGLANVATARTNLGLGNASLRNVSPTTGNLAVVASVASGNLVQFNGSSGDIIDSTIVGTDVLTKSGNLSGIASASTARTNIGAQASLGYTPLNAANNLSDVSSAATSRGNLGITSFRTSNNTNVTGNSGNAVNHGLGSLPSHYKLRLVIVCQSADNSYAAGDEVDITFGGSSRNDGATVWANGTQIGWSIGTNGLFVNTKGGGGGNSIDTGKWQIYAEITYNV